MKDRVQAGLANACRAAALIGNGTETLMRAHASGAISLELCADVALLPEAEQRYALFLADGSEENLRELLHERALDALRRESESEPQHPLPVPTLFFRPVLSEHVAISTRAGRRSYYALVARRERFERMLYARALRQSEHDDGLDFRVDIDVDMARAMLRLAHPDLPEPETDRVATLEAALEAGAFRSNFGSVSFNYDGLLFDGQHRLQAVARSGRPILNHLVRIHFGPDVVAFTRVLDSESEAPIRGRRAR